MEFLSVVETEPSTAWRDFTSALTRPAWQPLLVVVAINLFLGTACWMYFTSLDQAKHEMLMLNARDDYSYISGRLQAMSVRSGGAPEVAIIGGSSIRECVTSEADLAQQIGVKSGIQPSVHVLAGTGWQLLDTVAVADSLGSGFRGVVALIVNPNQLSQGKSFFKDAYAMERLGITSTAKDLEAESMELEVPRRFGHPLLDSQKYIMRRIFSFQKNAIFGAPKYSSHRYDDIEPLAGDKWTEHSSLVADRFDDYDENIGANLAILERVIGRLTKVDGVEVVMVDAIVNPEFVKEFAGKDFYAKYTSKLRSFCKKKNVEYWVLNDLSPCITSDFHDWGHLRNSKARERVTSALANKISTLIATQARSDEK